MEVYSYGNRKLFTLDQAHVMTIATSTKIVPNACIWYHLVILIIKSKPISKWIMPNWASHAHFSPFSNGLCQIGPLMPTLVYFQMDCAKLGLSCPLWPIKMDFGFIQEIYYLFEASREFSYIRQFYYPLFIKWNQANNSRKRNSPLNTRKEEIRVEIPIDELVCYLLCVNRIYILYSK